MSEIRVNSLGNETNTGGPELSGITEFSGQKYFIPPRGTTAQRPSGCPAGSIRFNTDSAHLEYWNGLVWLEFEASSVELGVNTLADGISARGTGTRGLFMGSSGTISNIIEYISIPTLGNGTDFGNLTDQRGGARSAASSTRGICAGGNSTPFFDIIDFVTFSSTGNADDFGDLTEARTSSGSASNSIRGAFLGGQTGTGPVVRSNVIDYITIATLGNAVDYGDLNYTADGLPGGICGSPIRGVIAGGSSPAVNNIISYVTISSTGNALDFGDLTKIREFIGTGSNIIRGMFAGGDAGPNVREIDFITIATTGNSQLFGDLQVEVKETAGVSSPTRVCFGGGSSTPSTTNTISFVTIATVGDAQDFGDLDTARKNMASCSNGHGGL